jgi:HlyD family secretion protein
MSKTVRWLVGFVVIAAFGAMLWLATRPPPLTVQGEVSADRVDISPRISARIVTLKSGVGDTVERGAVMAELESPQLVAARLAARAALAVAKADLDRINSIRPETVAQRQADLDAAKADETLAQETYNRQIELAKTGNVPLARVDEATRNLSMSTQKRQAAEAAQQLAAQGASKEERALAAAQVEQAGATLNQRDVDVAEFVIRAPISGQVTTRSPWREFQPWRTAFLADRHEQSVVHLQPARGFAWRIEDWRQIRRRRAGAKIPDHSGARDHDQRAGSICRVAGDAGHGRFRSSYL